MILILETNYCLENVHALDGSFSIPASVNQSDIAAVTVGSALSLHTTVAFVAAAALAVYLAKSVGAPSERLVVTKSVVAVLVVTSPISSIVVA